MLNDLYTQKKKLTGLIIIVSVLGVSLSGRVLAHCEIPCGIYGDRLRVELLRENFETVEKSMRKIKELQAEEDLNYNQLVRWINNKEYHANDIQEIVYQYFMNQRITPIDSDEDGREMYLQQLELLHRMLVSSMKTKQTTDIEHVDECRELLDKFETLYFDEEDEQAHDHESEDDAHPHSHAH